MLRRKTARLTPEQVLSSRPVRNENLTTEELYDGGLQIITKRRERWWVKLLGVVIPIPTERRLEVDVVGRQVWDMCDGEHTLKDMIETFQDEHKLTRTEAEWSLRNYLKDLGKRGLVAFAVEKQTNDE